MFVLIFSFMINRIKTWRLCTVSAVERVSLVSRVTDNEVGRWRHWKELRNETNSADVDGFEYLSGQAVFLFSLSLLWLTEFY